MKLISGVTLASTLVVLAASTVLANHFCSNAYLIKQQQHAAQHLSPASAVLHRLRGISNAPIDADALSQPPFSNNLQRRALGDPYGSNSNDPPPTNSRENVSPRPQPQPTPRGPGRPPKRLAAWAGGRAPPTVREVAQHFTTLRGAAQAGLTAEEAALVQQYHEHRLRYNDAASARAELAKSHPQLPRAELEARLPAPVREQLVRGRASISALLELGKDMARAVGVLDENGVVLVTRERWEELKKMDVMPRLQPSPHQQQQPQSQQALRPRPPLLLPEMTTTAGIRPLRDWASALEVLAEEAHRIDQTKGGISWLHEHKGLTAKRKYLRRFRSLVHVVMLTPLITGQMLAFTPAMEARIRDEINHGYNECIAEGGDPDECESKWTVYDIHGVAYTPNRLSDAEDTRIGSGKVATEQSEQNNDNESRDRSNINGGNAEDDRQQRPLAFSLRPPFTRTGLTTLRRRYSPGETSLSFNLGTAKPLFVNAYRTAAAAGPTAKRAMGRLAVEVAQKLVSKLAGAAASSSPRYPVPLWLLAHRGVGGSGNDVGVGVSRFRRVWR